MRVKLGELQKIVDRTLAEERSIDALREEISRVLGPSVITNVKLDQLAEGANYRLDVFEHTGRGPRTSFKASVMMKFIDSKSVEARRLAVRTLPVSYTSKFKNDADPSVRHAAARLLPLDSLKEMLKKTPHDDELRQITRQRYLAEAGVKTPEKHPLGTDVPGEAERLGDAVKQHPGPELSEQYYATLANKLIKDYGGNIEGQWEAPAAHRYCASVKATSHVDIDEQKLYDAIMKELEEKDDRTLERYSLKEVAQRLLESDSHEMPLYTEEIDPSRELLESDVSSAEYVKRAMSVFNVRESVMPRSLRKYRLAEGRQGEIRIPCMGKVPGARGISRVDEQALDRFIKSWNDVQLTTGEPIHIDWSHNPSGLGLVSFNVELK